MARRWRWGTSSISLSTGHQGDIHTLTGRVVAEVIDEFNRPASPDYGSAPVPPGDEDVEALFYLWRQDLPNARKYLVAVRDYVVASLWRRIGLRIMESYMLDIRDWRRDLGDYNTVHVRFGKGSRGCGPGSDVFAVVVDLTSRSKAFTLSSVVT